MVNGEIFREKPAAPMICGVDNQEKAKTFFSRIFYQVFYRPVANREDSNG
jgi:hypothetical protein